MEQESFNNEDVAEDIVEKEIAQKLGETVAEVLSDVDTTVEEEVSEAVDESEETVDVNTVRDVEEVLKSITELSDKIDGLSDLFNKKIMHTAHEEQIVDKMHEELQKYKEDMYAQLVRPILLDIIDMRDSIMRMSKVYSEKPEEEQVIPLKTFSGYSYDVQDILEKNNINIYKSEEGDSFEPIRHRVVKKVNTPVEELHGKIAETMSDGYEYMGKTISPEKIAVYTYESSKEKEGEKE